MQWNLYSVWMKLSPGRSAKVKSPLWESALVLMLALIFPPASAQNIQETVNSDGVALIQETPDFAFFGLPVWFRFELRNDSSSVQEDMKLVLWHAYNNAQPQFIPDYCEFSANQGRPILICDIDMIALYTSAAREEYADKGGIEARIREYFDSGNDILADSGARVRLNMLDVSELDLEELETVRQTADQFDSDPAVRAKRAEFGADLAVWVTTLGLREDGGGFCGLAAFNGDTSRGDLSASRHRNKYSSYFNVLCTDYTFIHEVGHNLGLAHSRRDLLVGAFDFSFGHGVQDSFATIMASETSYGVDEKLPYFANPDLDCNGHPCGVPFHREGSADAVKTINIIGPQVAGYFLPPWPEGMFASPANDGDGELTGASMSVGILTEPGAYNNEVAPGSTIDIVAEIRPDEEDLYERATLHFLVESPDGTALQLHRTGQISAWDGDPDNLVPFKYISQLHVVERFSVVEGLPLGEDFAGASFDLSLAYRVGEKVVRMSEPTTLSITE